MLSRSSRSFGGSGDRSLQINNDGMMSFCLGFCPNAPSMECGTVLSRPSYRAKTETETETASTGCGICRIDFD